MAYEFTMVVALPDRDADPKEFIGLLYQAGCDDAILGVGRTGQIALAFTRTSDSQENAVSTAIRDVKTGIPGCRLMRLEFADA